jgi:cytoskeletal protein CcmA (bactofilin family)
MAGPIDDLGIPNKPARPNGGPAVPLRPDQSRLGAGSNPLPPSPHMPGPAAVGAQPAAGGSPAHESLEQSVERRKLIVGRGIVLSGEINSCDRLVVEGSVQANLQSCQHMMIAETGLFEGNASIDEAEVHGRFEGDLMVRKRLLIRASGQVSGSIAYGEIEIEAGGQISGTIQAAPRK